MLVIGLAGGQLGPLLGDMAADPSLIVDEMWLRDVHSHLDGLQIAAHGLDRLEPPPTLVGVDVIAKSIADTLDEAIPPLSCLRRHHRRREQ